ncbi:MAG TPA: ECF-type sigma factor [Candidatus Solibacter sp.]|nr:ECF-type sigma factor [Candidatus Solibacter sp.]
MGSPPGEVTVLLTRMRDGDEAALAALMPLVYKELRRLAGHFMRAERVGHTLDPTALVHEAYLCLVGQDRAHWQNRPQFMAVAAQIMRRILLQYARRRMAGKRIAPPESPGHPSQPGRWEEILAVDEALTRLREFAPQQARIAEMRYFGGLSVEEVADALNISTRTVKRDWAAAKGWLHAALSGAVLE